MINHKKALQIPELFQLLAKYDISYVLIGSVAAKLYGAIVTPGDFDITPSLDEKNLNRLASMLEEINAHPPKDFGFWKFEDGERKWIVVEPTSEDLRKRESWKPDPKDISTFDFSFSTDLGEFDVVPELVGNYEYLISQARQMDAYGHNVYIAHVNDLLATLTVPRRGKDKERVAFLRRIQRRNSEWL